MEIFKIQETSNPKTIFTCLSLSLSAAAMSNNGVHIERSILAGTRHFIILSNREFLTRKVFRQQLSCSTQHSRWPSASGSRAAVAAVAGTNQSTDVIRCLLCGWFIDRTQTFPFNLCSASQLSCEILKVILTADGRCRLSVFGAWCASLRFHPKQIVKHALISSHRIYILFICLDVHLASIAVLWRRRPKQNFNNKLFDSNFGIFFSSIKSVTLATDASTTGWLCGWLDFDIEEKIGFSDPNRSCVCDKRTSIGRRFAQTRKQFRIKCWRQRRDELVFTIIQSIKNILWTIQFRFDVKCSTYSNETTMTSRYAVCEFDFDLNYKQTDFEYPHKSSWLLKWLSGSHLDRITICSFDCESIAASSC